MKAFVIFAYDISSNRRRNKVAKLLETFGDRVNYSVFELFISEKQIHQLVSKLSKMIRHKTDKVLVYRICRKCTDKKIEIGRHCNENSHTPSIIMH